MFRQIPAGRRFDEIVAENGPKQVPADKSGGAEKMSRRISRWQTSFAEGFAPPG